MGKGPLKFTIVSEYRSARATDISLIHAVINTPVYMPVGTQGTLKGFTTEQIQSLEPKIMLANTYFLNLRPGIDVLNVLGGLHGLMGWDRNFLTDSGGFQMVSLLDLSEVTEQGVHFISPTDSTRLLLTPEESIRTQQAIGSDIMMQLDDVVHVLLDPSDHVQYARIKEATERTTRWLDRCISAHTSKTQTLFAICQGHLDRSPGGFRDQCIADITARKDMLGGVAIGGLSGGEEKSEFWQTVDYCCKRLPPELPRYAMGVGFPLDLVVCATLGVDMFDCVYATRTARFGTALTSHGCLRLDKAICKEDLKPVEEGCPCECCQYSRAYIHALFKERSPVGGQLLSQHNVHYLLSLMQGLRRSIIEKSLDNYVNVFLRDQYRCRSDVPQWALDALASTGILIKDW